MPRKAGSGKFSAHLAVAVTPEMKQMLEDVASAMGVDKSVVTRLVLQTYLDRIGEAASAEDLLDLAGGRLGRDREDLEDAARG